MVPDKTAKKRRPEDIDVENIPFIPEWAVFPLDLLTDVAKVFADRSIAPRNHGVNKAVSIYALKGMIYCAHCEQIATEQGDPDYAHYLVGTNVAIGTRLVFTAAAPIGVFQLLNTKSTSGDSSIC